MPNYCHNVITIRGDETVMKTFYDAITIKHRKKKRFTFRATVPLTKGQDPHIVWGTKWDIGDYDTLAQTATCYQIRCDTAWAPPNNWAFLTARKYSCDIKIAYVESGCGVYGVYHVKCHHVTKDDTYNIADDDIQDDEARPDSALEKHMTKYKLVYIGG